MLPIVRRAWREYWRSPVAQAVDRRSDMPALLQWAWAQDEWHRVEATFRAVRLTEGSQGQLVMSPLWAYLRQLGDIIHRAEIEFGMTPLARSRLGLTIGQERLTAQELNRRLGAAQPSPSADEADAAWEAEWEEA